MKNIELTKEHKSKLLEMCEKLFPEYKYISYDIDIVHPGFISMWKKRILGFHYNGLIIHWFEFCMIHLAFKLCKKDFNTLSLNTYSNLIQYNQHPVDYLYEKFKKLK